MSLIEPAPVGELDPVQSALAHLPSGAYGLYQGLCALLWLAPEVPPHVKEGLRFLSAVRLGCGYCATVREKDSSGSRVLDDRSYDAISAGDCDWTELWGSRWAPLGTMAEEILANGEVSSATMERAREELQTPAIVQAMFFMLVVGASHRFSRAFNLQDSCVIKRAKVRSRRP